MFAFISSLPSAIPRRCSSFPIAKSCRRFRGSSKGLILAKLHEHEGTNDDVDATLSMDTLPSFEAMCWRAQQALCEEAEAADGLGTFSGTPATANPNGMKWRQREQRREMSGGRAFSHATVEVVRNRVQSPSHRNNDHETRQSVGVTLNLHPHLETLPRLRASVYYFQIEHLAWWFTGSVDLSHVGLNSQQPFVNTWTKICDQYRAAKGNDNRESTLAYLAGCLNYETPESTDRDVSFRFASDVVDAFLPSYLPLVAGKTSSVEQNTNRTNLYFGDIEFPGEWTPYVDMRQLNRANRSHTYNQQAIDLIGYSDESAESFLLTGGAMCESVVLAGSNLNSWRFSLSPSQLSKAGKMYSSLRDLADIPASMLSARLFNY